MASQENVIKRLEDTLRAAFQPEALNIYNDSARHAGHAGAGEATHFRIVLTAEAFRGQSRVARHRMIYSALAGEFEGGLHALQITAMAPDE
jgi:BolA protein